MHCAGVCMHVCMCVEVRGHLRCADAYHIFGLLLLLLVLFFCFLFLVCFFVFFGFFLLLFFETGDLSVSHGMECHQISQATVPWIYLSPLPTSPWLGLQVCATTLSYMDSVSSFLDKNFAD